MKMIFAFLVCLVLAGCNSSSGGDGGVSKNTVMGLTTFDGSWVGKGAVSNGGSSPELPCPTMTLSIEQTESKFSIVNGAFDCGNAHSTLGPADLIIRGQELWMGNIRKVGSINSNVATAVLDLPPVVWEFTVELTAGSNLLYHDSLTYKGMTVNAKGTFTKK